MQPLPPGFHRTHRDANGCSRETVSYAPPFPADGSPSAGGASRRSFRIAPAAPSARTPQPPAAKTAAAPRPAASPRRPAAAGRDRPARRTTRPGQTRRTRENTHQTLPPAVCTRIDRPLFAPVRSPPDRPEQRALHRMPPSERQDDQQHSQNKNDDREKLNPPVSSTLLGTADSFSAGILQPRCQCLIDR
jgi:hypothetical protein